MKNFARWVAAAAVVCGLAGPAAAQVGGFGGFGPASGMMLQVGAPNSQSAGETGIRPWAMVSGSYGSTKIPQPGGGPAVRDEGYGAFAGYGVAGGRTWRRSALGMNLAGMYRPELGAFRRSVTANILTLGVTHLAGQRTRVSAAASGGYSNGGMGFGGAALGAGLVLPFGMGNVMQMGPVGFGNPNENAFVDEEAFDTGVLFAGTTGALVHQLSQRWTVGAGGGAFMARRRQAGLAQTEGRSVYGLASYAINRTSAIGVQYANVWFSFRGLFGGNRAEMVNVFYQKSLGPKTMAMLAVGGFRMHTTFIGQAAVHPVFRDFMPGFTAFEVRQGVQTGTMAAGSIARNYRHGVVAAVFMRGLTPGNGIMLASVRDRATVSVSAGLPGRFGMGGAISYGEMRSLQQAGLRSQNLTVAGGVNRALGAGFGLGLAGGYRSFRFNHGPIVHGHFASVGITWAPPEALLVF